MLNQPLARTNTSKEACNNFLKYPVLFAQVPSEPHDAPIDALVTADGYVYGGARLL